MQDFNELIQGFQVADTEETTQPETPEDQDCDRLEAEIESAFTQHRAISNALTTFLGFSAVGEGVLLFTRWGLPGLATGTVGGIALALFTTHTLTKISLTNGHPSIDGEFWVELVKTGAAATALCVMSAESRETNKAMTDGVEQFIEEVKAFEITEPGTPIWTSPAFFVATIFLVLGAVLIFRRKQ
ncbi:MAG: hypothetical protein F6K31_07425 [Symploca sp. SIO2G7]|nr:hypothetical protein [Symploca sp. SIO2G7]